MTENTELIPLFHLWILQVEKEFEEKSDWQLKKSKND